MSSWRPNISIKSRSESLSRLKGIETPQSGNINVALSVGSESLSRLKGIETSASACSTELSESDEFGKPFPFEGN